MQISFIGTSSSLLSIISAVVTGMKYKHCMLIQFIAAFAWAIYGAVMNQADVMIVNIVLAIVRFIGWINWIKLDIKDIE